MYVWVDTSELTGDLLKAAQATHVKKWLDKMQHAFGQESKTVQAMRTLQRVGEQNAEVWEAMLTLSKFDGHADDEPETGRASCVKETKPEGIWQPPTGNKARRWQPKQEASLF